MANQQKVSNPTDKLTVWKKASLVFATIVGVIALIWGVLEFGYQIRLNKLKTVNQELYNEAIKPMGGVPEFSNTFGDHFWDICVDTGPCPRASDGWFILVDDKGEKSQSVIQDNLQSHGYITSGSGRQFSAEKDKIRLAFEFLPIGSQSPPYPAPAGKTWLQLSLYTYEVNY